MDNIEKFLEIVHSGKWIGLEFLLNRMSCMEAKRFQITVRKAILTQLNNEEFWETYLHLIIYKRGAYLPGVQSIKHLVDDGTLDFNNIHVQRTRQYLEATGPNSCKTVVDIMMPFLETEKQITGAFEAFGIDDQRAQLALLLKKESPVTYYLVFRLLKQMDDGKAIALKCCQLIKKRENDMAFNMVSLLLVYFDIDDIKCRSTLPIEPYELSHIDKNYQNFLRIIEGKRPKI